MAQEKAFLYMPPLARIEDFHSNIVYAAKDKEILFRKEKTAESITSAAAFDFDSVTVQDMVQYAKTVPVSELACVKEMIEMNCRPQNFLLRRAAAAPIRNHGH